MDCHRRRRRQSPLPDRLAAVRRARHVLRRLAEGHLRRGRHRCHDHARLRLRRHVDEACRRRVRLRRRRRGVGADRAGAPERAGEDHRGTLWPVAALAVRAQELRHHQLQGARGQEDQHHAGQQPQVLLSEGRREVRNRRKQDRLGEHGRRRDGGATDRQEYRRGAVLFDPSLLHQQGREGGRRGDHPAALRRGRASRSMRPRSSRPTR